MNETRKPNFIVSPNPENPRLVETVRATDHMGVSMETSVPVERPLTLFLNSQEVVTMMTIGDYPEYLAVGYLLNQNMLRSSDRISGIDVDDEIDVVVVRTENETDFEDKLKRKTLTSGCAQGTVFGDVLDKFDEVNLPDGAIVRTS